MKKHNLHIIFTAICAALCVCLSPINSVKASATYEITFKSGLHGTINETDSLSYRLDAGALFPDEPSVQAEEGYVFKGWNKALPSVGSTVEGKAVYVAQYDVLVSGVNYIVRYVNEDNVQIATPKASMAENGTLVTERAKNVAGYTYVTAEKSLQIDSENAVITFTYTLTNPNEVVRYEDETQNQNAQDTINTPNNNGNNNANQQPGNNANGNAQPEGEVVPEGETPLANNPDGSSSMLPLALGGGCLAILILGTMIILYRKKKQQQ